MELHKSQKMHGIHYDIRGPICEKAEELERQGVPIVKLNTGNPALFGFETPEYIHQSMMQAAPMAAAYSTSKGIDAAREAIARYAQSVGIQNVQPQDIFTGNGVSELIMMSLQALLNPGDEVLVPTPDYPLWTAAVKLSGGVPVHYLCDEAAGWLPDMDDLRRKTTPRTRAMVIINPNNPTGALYPKSLLEDMLSLARQNGLLVFSDEIYDRLVFDGKVHTPTAALAPDVPVVTFNGLSKSHHICGFRCGWMIFSGNKQAAAGYLEGLGVLASLRLCSNVVAQSVIPAALADTEYTRQYTREGGRLHRQRECAHQMLNAIPGITATKPQAGLYIFPRIDRSILAIEDDEQFVFDFLLEKHVLLTHGRSYNWPQPDHFRVVFLPCEEELQDVLGRLADFLAAYRR